ncbi:MAG: sigma-54-dependent transcriptional regulator [Thermoanaerobaculia bacterium]
MTVEGRLAIVEDDRILLDQLQWALKGKFEVVTAGNGIDGVALVDSVPDCFLIDLRLPPSNEPQEGLDLLQAIRRKAPAISVVVMTGEKDRRFALKAIELGAYDFFRKPVDASELALIVRRALERQRILQENQALKDDLLGAQSLGNLVGGSPLMRALFRSIAKVAPSDATVLITGESGTGKELVAQAIHRGSSRASGPFIAVNSSALPESLAESELFGHEKGAFTGAVAARPGKFELAQNGTLFLDEVATLSAAVQAKLLRVLESRQFERVGSSRTISANIRVLAATNEDLTRRAREGTFREDLLYRLNTVTLTIAPLRERGRDILVLLDSFAERFGRQYRKRPKTFSPEVRETLERYRWPGNVREMEHLVEMLTLMVEGDEVLAEHLPGSVKTQVPDPTPAAAGAGTPTATDPLPEVVARFERRLVSEALERSGGVKTRAAKALGIDPGQLKYLCRKYQL